MSAAKLAGAKSLFVLSLGAGVYEELIFVWWRSRC
jgi:hypothetical protein